MRFRTLRPVAPLIGAIVLSASTTALGQASDEVSPTGKGITGGALLGAEAVMLTEAALGVQPAWAYVVGGLAGGVGGGVAGFFVEDSDPKISLYLLAGGMALAIPTTVAVLSATAYDPPVDYTEDRGPSDAPVAEPPQPDAGEPLPEPAASKRQPRRRATGAPQKRRLQLPPPSLVAYDAGNLLLSVPAVELRDVYTKREIAQYGVQQATEVRVPVLSWKF